MNIIKKQRDEAWLHDETAEVAVPLEIVCRGGTAQVEYYPSAEGTVDEFLRMFGECEDTLFSNEAKKWAVEQFGDFLSRFGFVISPDSDDHYINYALYRGDGTAVPEVRRLTGAEGFRDLTETDIEGLCDGGYIVYAAVIGNDIVAAANTGEPVDDDTPQLVEIGVDTAEEYRRRGFGRACVSALAAELSRLGHTAVYECASGNSASIGLAGSLGGEVLYKKYYAVGFRD